jgi:hypothetical protein
VVSPTSRNYHRMRRNGEVLTNQTRTGGLILAFALRALVTG